jgi:hypothetical protein
MSTGIENSPANKRKRQRYREQCAPPKIKRKASIERWKKRLTSPRQLGRRCTERRSTLSKEGGWCAGRGQQSFHLQGGTWNPLKTWCACLLLPLLTTRWGGDPTNTVCASQIRSRAKLSSSSNYKPNAGASNQRQRARFLLRELFLSNFGQKHALVRKVAARMEIRAPAADHGYKRPPIWAQRRREMNENRGCALKIKGKTAVRRARCACESAW